MIQITQNDIAFALGVLGSVLGVMNMWREITKDKVKLKVIPKRVRPLGAADPEINISIEVINLSSFPLTIEEAGFVLRGTRSRLAIINPITTKNEQYPFRLEPRSSVTVYGKLVGQEVQTIKCAYATTSCGHSGHGNSPALKSLVKNG